jgi:hypothetical protein
MHPIQMDTNVAHMDSTMVVSLKVPHIITQILVYFVSQEPTSQCCGKGLGLHKDDIHTWQLSP